jgi:acyl carrier protein
MAFRPVPAVPSHFCNVPDNARRRRALCNPAATRRDNVCPTAWTEGALAEIDRGESNPQQPAIADDLIDLWKRVLRTDDITIDDDFFDIGGNSLSAIRLLPAIEEHFGVEPHISLVFDHPTPRQMAAALAAIGAKARNPAG